MKLTDGWLAGWSAGWLKAESFITAIMAAARRSTVAARPRIGRYYGIRAPSNGQTSPELPGSANSPVRGIELCQIIKRLRTATPATSAAQRRKQNTQTTTTTTTAPPPHMDRPGLISWEP